MVETGVSRQELNQVRMELYRQLPSLKQWVCVLYQELTEKGVPWEDGTWIELANITEVLRGGISMFAIPEQTRVEAGRIRDAVEHKTAERENLLCSLFGVLDEMETFIGNEAKRCNACGAEVFFCPCRKATRSCVNGTAFRIGTRIFSLRAGSAMDARSAGHMTGTA